MQEILSWIPRIDAANAAFRTDAGSVKLGVLALASRLLAAPRTLRKLVYGKGQGRAPFQNPWLPYWPALTAKPLQSQYDHAWTGILRQASDDIRAELHRVCDSFGPARYDSDFNVKPWRTYYFYLHGRANDQNLAACPRTREVLAQVPHNSMHVCFSALEPGGALHPHTGPTNASLTAHLGLENCAGTTLWVAGETAEYQDNEVIVFDDSFVHCVENSGSKTRYTLMITFWHPELNAIERQLLYRVVRTVK